jgi:hypothetical protein
MTMRRLMGGLLLTVLAGCGGAAGAPPSPKSVIADLKASGLPIEKVDNYTASSDPNKLLGRPDQYVGKANFTDRRLESDGQASIDTTEGGSVEVFESEDAAEKREEYVKAVTGSASLLAEYSYREGRVFLRLGSDLTPDQAKKYEAALRKAGGY